MLSNRRLGIIIQAAVIAVLSTVVYVRAIYGPFIWDDRFLIEQIEEHRLAKLLLGSFLIRPDGSGGDFFRPLATLSLIIDYALWGADPWFFHITNFLLHAAGAVMVWVLARRLIGLSAGLVAASLFAVHPAHCEPVCWISGRADLLYVPLLILAIIAYLRWRKSILCLFSILFALLALLAKETAITVVALVPLCLWLQGERDWRKLARSILIFGIPAALYFAVRGILIPHSPLPVPPASILQHAALVIYSLFMHFQILLVPHTGRLAYQVITDELVGLPMIQSLIALLILAYAAAATRREWPVFIFAFLWCAFALAPASGIIRGATQTVVAQRYVYLASAGIAMLYGVIAAGRTIRWPRVLLASAIFAYFISTSVARSVLWSDDIVFWERFVQEAPAIGWGYYHLGLSYHERGMEDRARRAYDAAAQLMPDVSLPAYGTGKPIGRD